MPNKNIVCLANSRKLSGRCIAGKELVDGSVTGWVRPVSARPSHEVSEYERQYEDGSDPEVLDVMTVPLAYASPMGHQTENWTLDGQYYWQKLGRVDWEGLLTLVDDVGQLWLNGWSTYNGENDEVPVTHAATLGDSLALVHVPAMTIRVFAPGAAFGNPKVRVQGTFVLGAHRYSLWITDPYYERDYLARGLGTYELDECCVTVSLSEEHEGNYYKLIAAIFERRLVEVDG